MQANAPFKMFHLNEDGESFCVACLPDGGLLLGIDPDYQTGQAVRLDQSHAARLSGALRDKTGMIPDEIALRVTRGNRGDPYRDGMDFVIGNCEDGSTSFFVEDFYLKDICEVIDVILESEIGVPGYE
jgi:hypothetical protein